MSGMQGKKLGSAAIGIASNTRDVLEELIKSLQPGKVLDEEKKQELLQKLRPTAGATDE
jgi:hypothetical protein